MKIAEAYVELRLDSKKAEQEGRAQVNSMGKSLGTIFGQVFGAAAFIGGIAQSIGAASDLNETVSKTKVIFGDASTDVTAWADNSARQFGLSKQAALDAASTFALFGQAAGLSGTDLTGFSEKLVGLASDLASFHNTSPEEAITAIGAAMRGENEPIRQYGVLIDDAKLKHAALELGLYSGKGALDDHARVMAAQKLIFEQTGTASGDFARTIDGVANSQRIAKAEAVDASASLGQNFLPIYQRAVEVVGALAKGFGELPAPVQTVIVALIGLVALSGPIGNMIDLSKKLTGALTTVGADGARSLSGLGRAGVALGGALAVAGVAMFAFDQHQKNAAENAKAMVQSFTDISKAADSTVIRQWATTVGAASAAGMSYAQANKLFAESNIEGARRVIALAEAEGRQGEELDQLRQAIAEVETEQRQAEITATKFAESTNTATSGITSLAGEAARLGTDLAGTVDPLDKMTRSVHGAGEAARLGADAEEEFAAGTKAAAEAHEGAVDKIIDSIDAERSVFDELATAASELKAAIDEVFGSNLDMESANRAAQKATDDLTAAFSTQGLKGDELAAVQERLKAKFDINTEAGRANREQVEANVKTILDYGVAAVGAGASLDEAAGSVQFMTDNLKAQLEQAGFTKEEIDAYLTTLGLTPENVQTSIELAGNEAAKTELKARQDQLNGLDEGATAEVQALVDAGKYQEALALLDELTKPRTTMITTIAAQGKIGGKAFASGTNYAPPGWALVGDDPRRGGSGELVNFGSGGGQVVDARDTRSVLEAITSGSGGDAGGMTARSGGASFTGIVNNYGGRPVTIDDINRALAIARMR